jgi:hypothetical protein
MAQARFIQGRLMYPCLCFSLTTGPAATDVMTDVDLDGAAASTVSMKAATGARTMDEMVVFVDVDLVAGMTGINRRRWNALY